MPAQARVTRVRPVMRAPTYVTRYIPTANWGEGVVVLVQLIKVMHNSKRNATVTNPKGWVEKLSRGCSDCHEGSTTGQRCSAAMTRAVAECTLADSVMLSTRMTAFSWARRELSLAAADSMAEVTWASGRRQSSSRKAWGTQVRLSA